MSTSHFVLICLAVIIGIVVHNLVQKLAPTVIP